MTILRLYITVICIQFFLLIELLANQVYFIRDIWTNQPISGAEIITSRETILSDEQGAFHLDIYPLDNSSISIKKDSYFNLSIKPDDLINPFIYLTPIENTTNITVVRARESDKPLRLPSHVSRIALDQSQMDAKESIADVLAEQNGIFMKSYGPAGQIQSLSIRGMSPEQTQVLFDGVPMNSLQLGSVDLGYYPLQSIGSLDIYRGGNALFGGSGSIGGSIDLHPSPLLYRNGYDVSTSFNSLNAFTFNVAIDLPINKYCQRFFVNHAKALNEYNTNHNGRSVLLENRDYQQLSYGYQNAISFSNHLSLNGFFSGYKREGGSPQAFINPEKEKENTARSTVENYLAKIRLDYHVQRFGINFQGYLRDEQMGYKNTTLMINFEPTHSIHDNQETGIQFRTHYLLINKILINSGVESAWQKINSTDAGKHLRQRTAFYLLSDYEIFSYLWFIQSAHLNGALRYEYFSNYGSVFLPGFGINIQGQHWQVYVTGSKNYRIPTFNELYWQPGGDPDLDSEKSINAEAGFEYGHNIKRILVFNVHVAVYQNRVEDQIKWLQNGSIWIPKNISEVLSRGVELETSVSDLKNLHQLSFNYHYGISKKRKAEFDGDNTIENQLPFLPREQFHIHTQSGWRNLRFGLKYSSVSFRYKTIENEADQILPAISVFDSWVGFEFNLKNHKIKLSMSVENLFNKKYEVMDGYPMPTRNYTLTFSSHY